MGTAFEKTDWQPGVTPYSTSEMNRIEDGIAGAMPVGAVIFSFALQTGFLELDGSLVSRSTYDALFDWATTNDLIGAGKPFGAGDGSTTFQLPDLRDRMPIGASATRPPGAQGGSEDHSHTNPNTSSAGGHSHTQPATGSAGSHSHSVGSTSTESHDHGDFTGSEGGHSHSSAGSHSHSTGSPSSSTLVDTDGADTGVASVSHTHSTGSAGSHTHGSAGGHTHAITLDAHSHSNPNTSTASSHSHSNPATDSVANHSHTQGATTTTGHLPPWAALTWLIRY